MSDLEKKVDVYLNTVERLESDIAIVDTGAALASIAISLRRIADGVERVTSLEANQYGETGMTAVTNDLSRSLANLIGELGMTLRQSK